MISIIFFFNDTATTEIYTLSLHDALPILRDQERGAQHGHVLHEQRHLKPAHHRVGHRPRSEEHTSELQSPCNLVCRLLLEKKKKKVCPQPTTNVLQYKERQQLYIPRTYME